MSRLFAAGDDIDLGTSGPQFLSTATWTVLAFIRPSTLLNDDHGIVSRCGGIITDCQFIYRMDKGASNGDIEVWHNGARRIQAGSKLTAGTWYLVAVTCDGSSGLELFSYTMDGVQFGNQTGTTSGDDANRALKPIVIGNSSLNQDQFEGEIAHVAYFAEQFTATEVKAYLFHPARMALSRPTTVQFYLPLTGAGSAEPDLSGNALNGTVTGATRGAREPPVPPWFGIDEDWVSLAAPTSGTTKNINRPSAGTAVARSIGLKLVLGRPSAGTAIARSVGLKLVSGRPSAGTAIARSVTKAAAGTTKDINRPSAGTAIAKSVVLKLISNRPSASVAVARSVSLQGNILTNVDYTITAPVQTTTITAPVQSSIVAPVQNTTITAP